MSKEQNLRAATEWGEAVNSGNLERLRQLVTPSVIEHDPAPGQAPGAQGYVDLFTELRTAFPDLQITPEHLTADDDTIALAYTVRGTHQGAFLGVEPTGKRIEARGVQIARYEDGRMVERWGSSDQLGILKQLGADVKTGLLGKIGL